LPLRTSIEPANRLPRRNIVDCRSDSLCLAVERVTVPQWTSYWLDGTNVNDYAGGGPASILGASLSVDAVEEFSVINANPPEITVRHWVA